VIFSFSLRPQLNNYINVKKMQIIQDVHFYSGQATPDERIYPQNIKQPVKVELIQRQNTKRLIKGAYFVI
jgi:hypothetical protein